MCICVCVYVFFSEENWVIEFPFPCFTVCFTQSKMSYRVNAKIIYWTYFLLVLISMDLDLDTISSLFFLRTSECFLPLFLQHFLLHFLPSVPLLIQLHVCWTAWYCCPSSIETQRISSSFFKLDNFYTSVFKSSDPLSRSLQFCAMSIRLIFHVRWLSWHLILFHLFYSVFISLLLGWHTSFVLSFSFKLLVIFLMITLKSL